MHLIAVIIFGFLYFSVSLAASQEEFYILPLGQGNGQLIVYNAHKPKNKVGVLYDLGSKSLQSHPKFNRHGDWNLHFRPSKEASKDERTIELNVECDSSPVRLEVSSAIFSTPNTTERKGTESQQISKKEDLQSFINVLLSNLQHIILFLSHTDVDHINYINEKTLSKGSNVTAFLCGDWFGNSDEISADKETSTTVQNVVSFLAMRENTHLEFPYYWRNIVCSNSSSTSEPVDFNQHIRTKLKTIKDKDSFAAVFKELANIASCRSVNAPSPHFLSGHFASILPQEVKDKLQNDVDIMVAINNTFVWSLNLPVGNVNDFSPIVSCTLPSLNLSVVFTGDAGNPVFQSVSCRHTDSPKSSFRETLNKTETDQHIVMLMLPHHGSGLYIGGAMLNFFRPDVFGISAGDGGQHGHPALNTISWIQSIYENKQLKSIFDSNFLKEKDYHIIAIKEQIDANSARYPHRIVKMGDGSPKFLCPNIYGCIKWDSNGIHTNFNNTIKVNSKTYFVVYTSHEFESKDDFDKKNLNDELTLIHVDAVSSEEKKFRLMKKFDSEADPYKYLVQQKGMKLEEMPMYVGFPVDKKIYFYRLILTDFAEKRLRDQEQ